MFGEAVPPFFCGLLRESNLHMSLNRSFRPVMLLSILLLSGCVQAQIASLRRRCDFDNDPRFEVLRGKLPLSPGANESPPTLIELSNNSRPTAAEREAIFAFDAETSICAREAIGIASRTGNASVVGLFSEVRLANQNLMKLLADGQITYSQYRNNSFQLLANAQKALGEYERAQQMANAQSQQAAASEMSATTQNLQAFNRQPSITTCNALGGSVSCITR
jgi:hypothetical protein